MTEHDGFVLLRQDVNSGGGWGGERGYMGS